MVERDEAALELLVAHEQLAEAVDPAMAHLDDPSPGLLLRVAPLDVGLFAAVADVRDVAMRLDDANVFGASVARVGAQMLVAPHWRALALDHDGAEYLVDSLAVIHVGRGHDERQRDATAVHQQVAFASFFFPDPSGSARPLLAPAGPSSSPRRCFAIARRFLPSRRTRPARLSTATRKSQPLPTRESACERRWRCQSAPWATPSPGNPCAVPRRWLRILGAPAWAGDRRRACVRRFCLPVRHAEESAAPRAARTHPSPPTIRLAWPRSRSDTAHSAARNDSVPIYG